MGKKIDLTGQKFGRLLVLEEAAPRFTPSGIKRTMWKCQCNCGNIKEVDGNHLRSGHTSSCGCKLGTHLEIDIGTRFGKLTVLEYVTGGYKCQCDCGKQVIVRPTSLLNGQKQSCGCLRGIVDHTGERFGRLVAIEHIGGQYLCICDCGNELMVDTHNLISGNTQSCGCLKKERSGNKLVPMIGKRFGKLVVIERIENKDKKVQYKCQCDCGNIKIVVGSDLRTGHIQSCGCLKSKGEMLISNWLIKHNINFKPQYCFLDYETEMGRKAYFDFAIFNDKNELVLLIEYNGSTHYDTRSKGWNTEERLKDSQERDKLKSEYCYRHNIPLLIIPYWDQDKLDSILTKTILYKEEGDYHS